jgi:hypothetical protein
VLELVQQEIRSATHPIKKHLIQEKIFEYWIYIISLSSSSDKYSMFVSLGNSRQTSIVNQGFNKINARFNGNYKFNDNLAGVNFSSIILMAIFTWSRWKQPYFRLVSCSCIGMF